MKKFFKRILMFMSVALIGLSNTGCSDDDDIIWDISPAEIVFRLESQDGRNLLDSNVEGNLVGREMYVVYKDETYPVDWGTIDGGQKSRYYLPFFNGLTVRPKYKIEGDELVETGEYQLIFGEFDGAENQDIDIKFFIADRNGFDEIKLVHRIKWKKHKPEITNTLTVNGKVSETGYATIVL